MIEKIEELRSFVWSEEENINEEKDKGAIKKAMVKTQKRKTASIQKSSLKEHTILTNK